jgi:hypothetical protein
MFGAILSVLVAISPSALGTSAQKIFWRENMQPTYKQTVHSCSTAYK